MKKRNTKAKKYKSLRRNKKYYNKSRRTYKRIKGGNYSNATNNIIEGFPVNSKKVVITVPGHGTMNEKEYKKYIENRNTQGTDIY
jgi:hypothetical protein